MPTTSDILHWRLPTLPDPADGPDALKKLAADAEGSVSGTDIQTYVPTWAAQGSVQPVNPAVKIARFRLNRGWCTVSIYVEFGGSTGGGSENLYLSLPSVCPSTPPRQFLSATLWVPSIGRYFEGNAQMDSGSNLVWPAFPASDANTGLVRWRNTDSSTVIGTSYPLLAGAFCVQTGGFIAVRGTYLAAES